MAYDPVIEYGQHPVQVTLGGSGVSYHPGDLIGYSGGWVKALATVSSVVEAELIVGQAGKSGEVVTAFRAATIYDADAPFTAGSKYYTGETGNGEAGGYTSTCPSTTNDLAQLLGIALSTSRAIFDCQCGYDARKLHA